MAPDHGRPFAKDGNRLSLCPEILRFGEPPALVAAAPAPRRLLVGGAGSALGLRAASQAEMRAAQSALPADAVSGTPACPR